MKKVLSLVDVDKKLAKVFREASSPQELPDLLQLLKEA